MRTVAIIALLLLAGAGLSSCGFAERREVHRGSNGEALAAIVSAIDGAERSVLARSPATPRPAVLEALAAARRRGVLVEFVVCSDRVPLPGSISEPDADSVPIHFDPTHGASGGAVLVIDARTVVRTSYRGNSNETEAAMIIRDNAELGARVAAEYRSHVARANSERPRRGD